MSTSSTTIAIATTTVVAAPPADKAVAVAAAPTMFTDTNSAVAFATTATVTVKTTDQMQQPDNVEKKNEGQQEIVQKNSNNKNYEYYDAVIPIMVVDNDDTNGRSRWNQQQGKKKMLGIRIGMDLSGQAVFVGYERLPVTPAGNNNNNNKNANPSKKQQQQGPAEMGRLIQNVGDVIVAINGVGVHHVPQPKQATAAAAVQQEEPCTSYFDILKRLQAACRGPAKYVVLRFQKYPPTRPKREKITRKQNHGDNEKEDNHDELPYEPLFLCQQVSNLEQELQQTKQQLATLQEQYQKLLQQQQQINSPKVQKKKKNEEDDSGADADCGGGGGAKNFVSGDDVVDGISSSSSSNGGETNETGGPHSDSPARTAMTTAAADASNPEIKTISLDKNKDHPLDATNSKLPVCNQIKSSDNEQTPNDDATADKDGEGGGDSKSYSRISQKKNHKSRDSNDDDDDDEVAQNHKDNQNDRVRSSDTRERKAKRKRVVDDNNGNDRNNKDDDFIIIHGSTVSPDDSNYSPSPSTRQNKRRSITRKKETSQQQQQPQTRLRDTKKRRLTRSLTRQCCCYPIGTRVQKYFAGFGEFDGEITRVESDRYLVTYVDGDEEEFLFSETDRLEEIIVHGDDDDDGSGDDGSGGGSPHKSSSKNTNSHKKSSATTPSNFYSSSAWTRQYNELLEYKHQHGHCLVPHVYRENIPLGFWVRQQRCLYQERKQGRKSNMTRERIRMLEDIGFVWELQDTKEGMDNKVSLTDRECSSLKEDIPLVGESVANMSE